MSLPVGTPRPRGVQLLFLSDSGLGGWALDNSENLDARAGRPPGSWPETLFQVSGSFLATLTRSKAFREDWASCLRVGVLKA